MPPCVYPGVYASLGVSRVNLSYPGLYPGYPHTLGYTRVIPSCVLFPVLYSRVCYSRFYTLGCVRVGYGPRSGEEGEGVRVNVVNAGSMRPERFMRLMLD